MTENSDDERRIEKAKKAAERKVAKRRRLQEEKQMEGGARKDVTRLSSEPALEPKITFVATKDGSSGVPRPRFSVDSCFRYWETQEGDAGTGSVRGNLGACVSYWEQVLCAPPWVLGVRNGYVLPFYTEPTPDIQPNQDSAQIEVQCVTNAVAELLKGGYIEEVGSGKPHLQVEALKVFKTCTRYNIRLEPEWVPRKMNQLSDYCSHVVDYDYWNRGSGHVHSELVWGNQLVVSTTYYHSKGDQACSMWLCPKGEEWAPFVVDYRILPLSEELIKPGRMGSALFGGKFPNTAVVALHLWLWVDHGVSTIVVSLLGVNIVAYCMINLSVLPSTDVLASGSLPATVLRSRADSTTKKYLGAFQQWKFWADTRQGVPSFPVQEIQLVLYMQHLRLQQLGGLPLVKPTLEGLKRMLAKPKVRKEPVTADMLKAMVEATGSEPPLSKVSVDLCLSVIYAPNGPKVSSVHYGIEHPIIIPLVHIPPLTTNLQTAVSLAREGLLSKAYFDIMALLHSFPKDTACGPSGLRIQHLIEAAEVPLQFPICAVLRDWSTYLSLARFLYKWLGSSQGLGVTCPAGAEKRIHGLRGCVDEHWHDADFAILKIDLHNAFNRSQQLQRMLTVHPYKWYIDDGVVAGPIAAIAHVLAIIQDRGPPLGLYINIAKCELFRVSDLSTFPDEIKRSNVFPPIEILGVPIGDLVFCATFVAQKQSEASKLLQHLEAVGSIDHQKVLSSKIEDRQFGNLFHSATLTDKARLLSISSPPTSAWLSVTPSPRLNLHLEPAEFQVALKWWLGIPVVQGQSCPQCPSFVLDDFGHHSLSCKHGGDVVSRHNKLRDVFLYFCQRACLGPHLEMGCGAGYTNSQSRPADFLVPNWDLGKPAAFDLSIMSTLHPSVLQEASMTAGSAALVAENRKHKYNDRKCEELGWVCIPLVVKTYGCWGAAAVAAFSKLAGCLSIRLNQPKSKIIYGIYSCLGLALVRANCRAILSRLT
ncbi:hypothetical protein EMCRGX_G015296 [Ephydatia muelleri]